MTYDRTRLKAKEFDRARVRRLGAAAVLVLAAYNMDTGEETQATVTGGWLPTQTDKGLIIEIIENAPTVAGTLTSEQVYGSSRVKVNGKTYKIKPLEEGGITPPLNAPRLWTIRCGFELRPQA
jgi:hypothetical protein